MIAELDPFVGRSADGETAVPVAACADRTAALRAVDNLMASGEWGQFGKARDDLSVSDTGWAFGLESVSVSGELRDHVHLVFVEFDGSSGTPDGEHFVVIEGCGSAEEANRLADKCRSNGEWGPFDTCEMRSSTGWYVGIEAVSLVSE